MVKLAPDYRRLTSASAAATTPKGTSSRGLKRKRPNTKVACNNCRQRKWACNGDRPQCLSCRTNGINCVYTSVNKSETHTGILKRENDALRKRSGDLEELLNLLRNAPIDLAQMALLKLRHDPTSALHLLRAAMPKSHLSEQKTARTYLPQIQSDLEFELMAQYPIVYPMPDSQASLALLVQQPQSTSSSLHGGLSSGKEGPTQQTGAINNVDSERAKGPWPPQLDPRLRGLDITFWTNVSATNELAAGAISLFLEITHPFLGLFDADLFLDSLVSRSLKYCSSFLVNSLLSFACQGYSAKYPLALAKSYEFKSEAKRLFVTAKSSDSLANLGAIALLWISHSVQGSGKDGLPCVGAAVQMAKRMRLFGVSDRLTAADIPGSTLNLSAMAHTAWGSFNLSMIQTLYATSAVTKYPPALPIPGCVETEASSRDDAAEKSSVKFSGPGDTFQSFCKFWKAASGILFKYRPIEGPSNTTLEFTLSEYHKLLALTRQLPESMTCRPGAASHVFIFHVLFHAVILDIFRPFIADKHQHGYRYLSRNTSSPQEIFDASLRQMKHIILVFSSYPESAWGPAWHVALMYVAPAVVKDRRDPEWRAYFFLCLYHYKILARCFSISEWIIPGLLAIAVQHGAISSLEAKSVEEQFREENQRRRRPEGGGAGFVLDMDLALNNWTAAQAETLVNEFEDLSLFNEYTDGIV